MWGRDREAAEPAVGCFQGPEVPLPQEIGGVPALLIVFHPHKQP